jgi:hypothetical protein
MAAPDETAMNKIADNEMFRAKCSGGNAGHAEVRRSNSIVPVLTRVFVRLFE